MGYHSVVCIKQVPDTGKVTGDAMKADGTINRAALPAIFNPEDKNALEAALKVRDQHGGKVTVITMGLPAACNILREALMCGADEAFLITDRRAAASDTLATSYILSQAVKKLNPDLVFCGRQAIDGDTAQTGPQIAEKIGATLVTYLEGLEIKDGFAYATRNIGTGTEKIKAKLPALFTVMEKCGDLRPQVVRRTMKYKKFKAPAEGGEGIGQWTLDDIGCDMSRCGKAGSPTLVNKIVNVVLAGGAFQEFQPTDEDINKLIGGLIADHTIG